MAGRKKSRARGKRAQAIAIVTPDPSPWSAQDQADLIPPPSSTSAAAVLNGACIISPWQAQQITPTPAAAAAAYPASSTRSATPQLVQGQASVNGANHLGPAPSLSAPGAQDPEKFNYAIVYSKRGAELYEYLKSHVIYEEQLCTTTFMNARNKTSDPYIIQVSFKQMIELKADGDLITDICNSLKNLYLWIIPAAEKFLHDNGCVNQEMISGNPCISFSGFPESMQKFEDFTKNIILSDVSGVLTFYGRLLIEMPMFTMLENHLQKGSWNGNFSIDDILIIKRSEWGRVTYEMKILQKPVKLEGQRLHEARCRDLGKVAEIFMPLYQRAGVDCPVYILVLKEDLEKAKQFVAKIGFMKYLTHHPAIMPSIGRITFLTKLHAALSGDHKLVHYDWITIVESEYEAKKQSMKDIIHVVMKVYRFNMKKGNKYQNTGRDLLRFMRNVLEHGEYDKCQLELYLAKMFSGFLPSLMRSLMMSGRIDEGLQALWLEYEVSKLIKIDGMQAQVVTTD